MIGRVRRWRFLALLLLLATPGVAGTVLDGLHPCPENAPWTASAEAAAHAGHGSGNHEAPSHSGECHCLGACVGAAAVIPFDVALPTIALDAIATSVVPSIPAGLPVSRPSDRLPPSTAPPLV
jgi:hypothetical protein